MNVDDTDEQWRMMVIPTIIAMTIASIVLFLLRMKNRSTSSSEQPNKKELTTIVTELIIYPIKSCAPMKVQSALVTEIGFLYDRFIQVSDSNGNYLTPRDKQNEKLFHIKPIIITVQDTDTDTDTDYGNNNMDLELTCSTTSSGDSTTSSTFRVNNFNEKIKNSSSVTKEVKPMIGPNVQLQDLGDEAALWLSNVTNIKDCRLTAIGSKYHRLVEINPDQGDIVPVPSSLKMKVPPVVSLADEAPFLLTSSLSLMDLNTRLKVRGKSIVDMQRFRPNIVVSGKSLLPWEEDTWKRIKIGGVEFHVWQRCGRCTMATIDRQTLQRGPEPLATLSTFRERDNGMRNFGMHMIPIINNTSPSSSMEIHAVTSLLEVGHTLEVLEYDEQRLKEWKRLFSS
jgi:uncharacterized protein YcbX